MLDFARLHDEVKMYLPDEKDWVHLDRQWLGDVLYTLDAQAIDTMVKRTLEERQQKIEESRDELIDMKPEFAEALERCISFSNG